MDLTLSQLYRWEKLKPRERMEFVQVYRVKVSVRGRTGTQNTFIYLFTYFFHIFIGIYLLNNGVLVSAL